MNMTQRLGSNFKSEKISQSTNRADIIGKPATDEKNTTNFISNKTFSNF